MKKLLAILSIFILASCSFSTGKTSGVSYISSISETSEEVESSLLTSESEESSEEVIESIEESSEEVISEETGESSYIEESSLSEESSEEIIESSELIETSESGSEISSSEEIVSESSEVIESSESEVIESSENSSVSEEKPAKPVYIDMNNDITIKRVLDTQNMGITPSTGNVKMLVIPILFSDKVVNQTQTSSRLDAVFNANRLSYFYSVSKYYELSSYGRLHFDFEIAPWYKSNISTTTIKNTNQVTTLMTNAYNDYYVNHVDEMEQFDQDKDGYADGVWFIYGAPDYYKDYSMSSEFWAYTTHLMPSRKEFDVNLNTVGWASYDFMNEGKNSYWQDAHTYIHETGHMLGLDDYYSYDQNISPLGGVDMMDNNIADHNAWSKYALGWINPKLMINNGKVNLDVFQEDGDAIFISVEDEYCTNPFGEFIVLEYYTASRLNELDSKTAYNYIKAPNGSGLKVIHVDARVCEGSYAKGYYDDSYAKINFDEDKSYLMVHANSLNRSLFESQYTFNSIIDAAGRVFYNNTYKLDNDALWSEGEAINFEDEYVQKQFVNETESNSGSLLPLEIYLEEVNSSSMTLDILL